MFRTTINLVPTGQTFNIYSGLTSSTTVNLIASNVSNSFEHNFDITDLVVGSNTLQHYFLRLSCEECGDLYVKVKAHDIEYCQPKNPFDFIFDLTLKSVVELDENPSLEPTLTNPIDWFTDVFLYNGLSQSQSCLICPPCNGFYSISTYQSYGFIFQTMVNVNIFKDMLTGCCLNYAMTTDTFLNLEQLVNYYAIPNFNITPDEEIDGVVYKYSSCDNGFKEKVLSLKTLDPSKFDYLIENGIFEIGNIGDSTGLSNLITFYTGNSINNYDGVNTINETIVDWLDISIFFLCYNNDYTIGGSEELNKFIESTKQQPIYIPGP